MITPLSSSRTGDPKLLSLPEASQLKPCIPDLKPGHRDFTERCSLSSGTWLQYGSGSPGRKRSLGPPCLERGRRVSWLGEKFCLCLELSVYTKRMLAWEEEAGLGLC